MNIFFYLANRVEKGLFRKANIMRTINIVGKAYIM